MEVYLIRNSSTWYQEDLEEQTLTTAIHFFFSNLIKFILNVLV